RVGQQLPPRDPPDRAGRGDRHDRTFAVGALAVGVVAAGALAVGALADGALAAGVVAAGGVAVGVIVGGVGDQLGVTVGLPAERVQASRSLVVAMASARTASR